MPMRTLDDLLQHMIRDIYHAEKQIEKKLPKMAKKAGSNELSQALEHHHQERLQQIENIQKALDRLDISKRGEKCQAIQGILDEAKEIMEEIEDRGTLDAGIVASAQAVEHYEITRYGTIVAWAKKLGHDEVAKLMQQNLDQEYAADQKLSELAGSKLNAKAA